jgi:hypothetical protein
MSDGSSPTDERPPLTVAQFADRFNLPRSTAYLLVATGVVRSTRYTERRIRIPVAAAEAFAAGDAQPGVAG